MQYALIESGRVANISMGDEASMGDLPGHWVPAEGVSIGWAYSNGEFTPPASDEPVEADRRITRLAFRKRFTQGEKVALELAALDDPAAPQAQRAQAAALRAYLKDVDSAQFINLTDAHVSEGVHTLEAAGLLEEGRAAEILTAPVAPEERP